MRNYDFIIGTKILFFSIKSLLSDDCDAKTDTLNMNLKVVDEVMGSDKNISVKITGIMWNIYNVGDDSITYKLDFSTAEFNKKKFTGKPHLLVSFNLVKVINNGDEWLDIRNLLECNEISTSLGYLISNEFKTQIENCKHKLIALFFKDTSHILPTPSMNQNKGSKTIFLKKNKKNILNSYLCIASMLEDSDIPKKAIFPANEMEHCPDFIFYISPYAYLKMGLYGNMAKTYPKKRIKFSNNNKEFTIFDLPLDRDEMKTKLNAGWSAKVVSAVIKYLRFKIENSCISIKYEGEVVIFKDVKILDIEILSTGIPNPYKLNLLSESSYELFLNNGKIDVRELTGRRINNVIKSNYFPFIDDIAKEINTVLKAAVVICINTVLPIAIEIGTVGVSFFHIVALFTACYALGEICEKAFQYNDMKSKLLDLESYRTMHVSFDKWLPFQLNKKLLTNRFYLDNGLVISGMFGRAYLLPGDYLLSDELVIGDTVSYLRFQNDGNLVLYRILGENTDAIWCSDGYNNWKTANVGINKVKFDDDGSLKMYAGEQEVCGVNKPHKKANLLFIDNDSIRFAVISEDRLAILQDRKHKDNDICLQKIKEEKSYSLHEYLDLPVRISRNRDMSDDTTLDNYMNNPFF